MNFFIITINILFLLQFCIAQNNTNKESLNMLTDSIIKREIASFTIKGSILMDSFIKPKLEELLLIRCSTDFVVFSKTGGILRTTEEVYIDSKIENSKQKIKKVQYVIHSHFGIVLPDSSIVNIVDPIFCLQEKNKNSKVIKCCPGQFPKRKIYAYEKQKPLVSNCKVFKSEDKKRIYIYMLNGKDQNYYEVTWIIKDSNKYYGRVIDIVN